MDRTKTAKTVRGDHLLRLGCTARRSIVQRIRLSRFPPRGWSAIQYNMRKTPTKQTVGSVSGPFWSEALHNVIHCRVNKSDQQDPAFDLNWIDYMVKMSS